MSHPPLHLLVLTSLPDGLLQREPLPADSPLWAMPSVLISAHIAGLFSEYDARFVGLFIENLRRYLAGQPLLNQVDRRQGY